ncbi:MAG: tetratricopeptide repeat-containing protein [Chitinophagaceae bacterium]
MEVFIVRPFGKRKVLQKDAAGNYTTKEFDFDLVQEKLIIPALEQSGIEGGTTGKIFEAGSIHEDMFSLLLVANMVIADITIHNANVFYELGIRHALRDKRTVLIKCPDFDETPFDILGYRYIPYQKDDPSLAVAELVKAVKETMDADRKDSPVFDKLDNLASQDPERFLAIPEDFDADLRITTAQGNAAKLAMMATEIAGFQWQIPGLRKIGEALYKLRCLEPARIVFERVLKYKKGDQQSNDRLATIYQRLAESEIAANLQEAKASFESSNMAIENLLAGKNELTPWKRAEYYALKARNAKALWLDEWKNLPEAERSSAAIGSKYLAEAMELYEQGFLECLNHFYSGINTLGLLLTTITLADQFPEVWELHFDSQDLALQKLNALKERFKVVRLSVLLSIEAGKKTTIKESEEYAWLRITEADYICLTEARPPRVKLSYQNALREANNLNFDATVRQLLIYQQLGIVKENIKAALEALPDVLLSGGKTKQHTLLFTGHMIDQPGRAEPRFPPEKELAVRKAIKEMVALEQEKARGSLTGLAGGASGGDILFHEVCEELGIKSHLYLALPRDQFVAESVSFAGPKWIERFDRLFQTLPWQILSQTKDLPGWLKKKENYSIWERNNLWMLNQALDNGGIHMSMIALWNKKGGDGPGGTEHMVKEASERGARTLEIDINVI